MSTTHTSSAPEYRIISYKPLVSWWVGASLIVLLVVLLYSLIAAVWSGLPLLQTTFLALTLLSFILYIVDNLFFLRYQLTADGLLIHSQLRYTLLPYNSILGLRNGSLLKLISALSHKRYALSTKNIVLNVTNHSYKTLALSPADPKHFISTLLHNMEVAGVKGKFGR